MERKMPAEYEQLEIEYPNELNKSNDEQLYLSAFEYNRARYPEEHADVMDKYFAQIEEGNTKYSQWVLDSWVFNLIKANGKRIDDV
jgi:hypothetical protein